jgi:N-acetylglucosaminyl-diphospho-decaprenol L-rhamnosyltransferase
MINTDELTIQIVLYEETKDLIFRCLEHLKNFKILILDNASNKKLRDQILSKFDIKEYIHLNKNLGYSKGHNYLSNKVDTKYILILNADCQIDEKNIKNLLKSFAKYKDCGLISPTTFNDKFEQSYNGGLFFENQNQYEITKISGDTCFQTVLGAAMLIEKKFFIDLGKFNENMFLFFSDYDLCKKIRKSNKSVIQTRSAKALHIHGKSKVKNNLKKTYLREFNMTYDQLYYFNINKLDNILLKKLKKQHLNYLFKLILNLLIFKYSKSIYYFSRISAYYKFLIKN